MSYASLSFQKTNQGFVWLVPPNNVSLRFQLLLQIVLLAPILAGCGSISATSRSAFNFHRQDLVQGRLMIGGITALGGGEYLFADEISRHFVEQVALHEPMDVVMSLPAVRAAIGATNHLTLEKRFSNEGALATEDFNQFIRLQNAPRYLLWIDVGGKSSDRTFSLRENRRAHLYTDPATGEERWVPDPPRTRETSVTQRDLDVIFTIWDLRTRTSVWVCRTQGSSNRIESHRQSRSARAGRAEAGGDIHDTLGIMVEKAVASLPP